jgi:hypothetical protein
MLSFTNKGEQKVELLRVIVSGGCIEWQGHSGSFLLSEPSGNFSVTTLILGADDDRDALEAYLDQIDQPIDWNGDFVRSVLEDTIFCTDCQKEDEEFALISWDELLDIDDGPDCTKCGMGRRHFHRGEGSMGLHDISNMHIISTNGMYFPISDPVLFILCGTLDTMRVFDFDERYGLKDEEYKRQLDFLILKHKVGEEEYREVIMDHYIEEEYDINEDQWADCTEIVEDKVFCFEPIKAMEEALLKALNA